MKALRVLALLPLAALAGCQARCSSDREQPLRTVTATYELPPAKAYEFVLRDGTRCVAYREAVVCEWKVRP